METKKIENLKNQILTSNWKVAKLAIDDLVKIGDESVIEFLIGLLDQKDAAIRNKAALALSDLKAHQAVKPLLTSIFKPENRNYNGTMVYALQELNCEHLLVEIFQILFYHDYEAKMGAMTILEEQIFSFDEYDLFKIQKMWQEYNENFEKGKGFDNEALRLEIQEVYEGFMKYLK